MKIKKLSGKSMNFKKSFNKDRTSPNLYFSQKMFAMDLKSSKL